MTGIGYFCDAQHGEHYFEVLQQVGQGGYADGWL